eukprot:GEMP01043847.1.p1 GENE.GEMP01043847.1~~GEMP01043847.1.p1  ORF type:complete len:385 (+),score=35.31 GEMP01043847.1:73-1155(+)
MLVVELKRVAYHFMNLVFVRRRRPIVMLCFGASLVYLYVLLRDTSRLVSDRRIIRGSGWPPRWEELVRRDFGHMADNQVRMEAERAEANCTYNFFHVVMPMHNVPIKYLFKAVSSVLAQDYPRFNLYVHDDGSADIAVNAALTKICESGLPHLDCTRSDMHKGPGYSKFEVFSRAYSVALPQDVIVVVDGDDFLYRPNALAIINKAYQRNGCWNSWGTVTGKYEEQQGPLPPQILNGTEALTRKNLRYLKTWLFSHPRSFKAFLWPYMSEKDFQNEDGSWLIKVTDRAFIFNMLELSGVNRSCFIPDILYSYVWGATPPSINSVSAGAKHRIIKYICDMPPHAPLTTLPNAVPGCDLEAI